MPYDFRTQDQRTADSGRTPGTPIGFHELRQACEISALREDLERILQDTGALRDSIEDAVEQVRQRFASMTAEELADSEAMAPLLQFAVSTLLSIRDEARRINTQTGPVDDDDRPTRPVSDPRPQPSPGVAATPQATPLTAPQSSAPQTAPQTYAPPPSEAPPPSFAAEPPRDDPPPPPAPAPAPVLSPFVPRTPAPAPQRPAPPDSAPDAAPAPSWLSPLSGRKGGGSGVNGTAPRSGNVDWLSRPKR